jgi:TolA-binding protein
MKSTERHKLKENEFARTVTHARDTLEQRKRDIMRFALVVVLAVAMIGGYAWWRQSRNAKANAALATALAAYEAPVVPVAAPTPGSPMPVPQAGTFPTEQAKLDAALPKLMEAADRYPGTDAGIAARFHAASALAALGRFAEAEQRFQEVADKGGNSIYSRTARLGLAEARVAQGKFDEAIQVYESLANDRNGQIPADAVLMELGRAYLKAGRKEDAAKAFTRVADEFPESIYATDAKARAAEARKS